MKNLLAFVALILCFGCSESNDLKYRRGNIATDIDRINRIIGEISESTDRMIGRLCILEKEECPK